VLLFPVLARCAVFVPCLCFTALQMSSVHSRLIIPENLQEKLCAALARARMRRAASGESAPPKPDVPVHASARWRHEHGTAAPVVHQARSAMHVLVRCCCAASPGPAPGPHRPPASVTPVDTVVTGDASTAADGRSTATPLVHPGGEGERDVSASSGGSRGPGGGPGPEWSDQAQPPPASRGEGAGAVSRARPRLRLVVANSSNNLSSPGPLTEGAQGQLQGQGQSQGQGQQGQAQQQPQLEQVSVSSQQRQQQLPSTRKWQLRSKGGCEG
jgi:hypothetical protein